MLLVADRRAQRRPQTGSGPISPPFGGSSVGRFHGVVRSIAPTALGRSVSRVNPAMASANRQARCDWVGAIGAVRRSRPRSAGRPQRDTATRVNGEKAVRVRRTTAAAGSLREVRSFISNPPVAAGAAAVRRGYRKGRWQERRERYLPITARAFAASMPLPAPMPPPPHLTRQYRSPYASYAMCGGAVICLPGAVSRRKKQTTIPSATPPSAT